MKTFLLLGFGFVLYAQVSEPRIGAALLRDGSVRELKGSPGAFVIGDTLASGAASAASSGELTVVASADSGQAVFGFTRDGKAAYAWYPGTATLVEWATGEVFPVKAGTLAGHVLALSSQATGRITALVRRDDGLHKLGLRLSDGAVEVDEALPIDSALAVILTNGTVVYITDRKIISRAVNGQTTENAAPGNIDSLALLGDGWIHAATAAADLAIRIRPDAVEVFVIPEVIQ